MRPLFFLSLRIRVVVGLAWPELGRRFGKPIFPKKTIICHSTKVMTSRILRASGIRIDGGASGPRLRAAAHSSARKKGRDKFQANRKAMGL